MGAARDVRLGLPRDEAGLVRALGTFAARRAGHITVVFDGTGGSRRAPAGHGRVRVVFSGGSRSADEAILERIEGSPRPKEITLVSSDRELGFRARELGSRVMGCAEFAGAMRRIDASSQKHRGDVGADEKAAPPQDVDWEEYFKSGKDEEP